MADATFPQVAVVCRSWGDPNSDESFALRGLAGALSRHATVNVVVPGRSLSRVADGLFDLDEIGIGPDPGSWPTLSAVRWPTVLDDAVDLVLVSAEDLPAMSLVEQCLPSAAIAQICRPDRKLDQQSERRRWIVGGTMSSRETGSPDHWLGFSVPINALASVVRHNGLGFTDFLLMLTNRTVSDPMLAPPPEVAWVTARFPDLSVVFVEGAQAIVWRGRAHRGTIAVDTRTDLWRLVAHARVTVDLRPGALIGRELIESLRYGTPVIAPHDSIGALLKDSGGCATYRNIPELLGAIETVNDPALRSAMSRKGRHAADRDFGDPSSFVDRVGTALAAALVAS